MKLGMALCAAALAGGIFFLLYKEESPALAGISEVISRVIPRQDVRMLAVGDMLFDRHIREVSTREGGDFIFSCIGDLLYGVDFAVGNLEGPITPHQSRSMGTIPGAPDNFSFTFPTTTAALLARHNFEVVSIGNNHITDRGRDGLRSTQEFLHAAGVGYFGGVYGDEALFRMERSGIRLSFIAYNEFGGSSPQKIAEAIAAEHAEGRMVIVYAHWGDEYIDTSVRLRPVATLFAESGAALVIGSHPHVILPREYIGETLVYYSLGNFIFDQYWNADVSQGLALLLTIKKSGHIEVEEYTVKLLRDGRTCPAVQESGI